MARTLHAHSSSPTTHAHGLRAVLVALVLIAAPMTLQAQTAAREADAPSQRLDTRIQSDSITVHLLRNPKGKPAEFSAGGATAARARKFSGKSGAAMNTTPVETPLPVKARTTKP